MKKQLISTTAAAAIAMSSFAATPAKALTDEEALFLFGVAAIAMIASANNTNASTPPPSPVTHSTGPVTLRQTYTVNFDNGTIGGPGTDLWFQAVNPTRRYLKPRNGAKIAVGDRSNRGYAGCKVASYTHHRVPLAAVPVGSYVCMKTSAGRISQFRVNAVLGGPVKRLKLGYTTWQ